MIWFPVSVMKQLVRKRYPFGTASMWFSVTLRLLQTLLRSITFGEAPTLGMSSFTTMMLLVLVWASMKTLSSRYSMASMLTME